MIICAEGRRLINPLPSLLICLHLSASFSFSGTSPHLELFKGRNDFSGSNNNSENSLLPLLLPSPTLLAFGSFLFLPPPFAVAFVSTPSLSVYFFWSAGSALEEARCDTPGSYSLVMCMFVHGGAYPEMYLALFACVQVAPRYGPDKVPL